MKISLITACLAGVAHSKMAATALKKEALKRGHEIYIVIGASYPSTVPLLSEPVKV